MPDTDIITFEDFRNENGITFWWASDLMKILGYANMKDFHKVILRATKAINTLWIDCYENIIKQDRDGEQDYKLTRFACYMIAMNGDPKKEQVAHAQRYFVEQTRKLEMLVQNPEEMERLLIRDELKAGNISLSRVAYDHEVQDIQKFQNKGYLWFYNMINVDLARKRNVDKKELLDRMGRTELAANLFRITQTEERIKNKNLKWQSPLEKAHYDVWREVREMVIKNTGEMPENLPTERHISQIQKDLKAGHKEMKNIDKKPTLKKKKPDEE